MPRWLFLLLAAAVVLSVIGSLSVGLWGTPVSPPERPAGQGAP